MKCNRHNLSFWAIFYPFNPLATRKIKILKNWKKTPEDIIIFHMCTINYNHMMYGSWDIERDRQNFFVILDNFLPIYPLKTRKIKVLKTWKNAWRYYHFTQTSVPKIRICYTVPEIWRVTNVIVIFHFWLFFVLLPT